MPSFARASSMASTLGLASASVGALVRRTPFILMPVSHQPDMSSIVSCCCPGPGCCCALNWLTIRSFTFSYGKTIRRKTTNVNK